MAGGAVVEEVGDGLGEDAGVGEVSAAGGVLVAAADGDEGDVLGGAEVGGGEHGLDLCATSTESQMTAVAPALTAATTSSFSQT